MEPHSSDVCSLCKSQHSRMSNVQTWQNSQATQYIQTLGIALDSLICRPCRDDVRRVLADPSHVPRWSKRKERSKCCIKSCLEVSFVSSNLANTEKMNQIIKQVDFEIEGDDIPIPTPLCKHHYYTIYNLIQPQQTNCQTCGVNLKQSHTLRSFSPFPMFTNNTQPGWKISDKIFGTASPSRQKCFHQQRLFGGTGKGHVG